MADGAAPGMSTEPTTPAGITLSQEGKGPGSEQILTVNFGPHHPSTHGVLRLIVDVDGEVIRKITPVIGYLHTGIEKTAEALRYQQAVTVTDRHDYLSPLFNNLSYAMAVEKLMGVEVPSRAQALRVIMCELCRISSHMIWLGTSGLEMGAISMLWYCLRERDKVLDLNEEISGFRMHTSYIRPGGVFADATSRFLELCNKFVDEFPASVDEYETLLTENPIFKLRTQGIGYLSREDALRLGMTGPMLRGSGVNWDQRKPDPYSAYAKSDFQDPADHPGGGVQHPAARQVKADGGVLGVDVIRDMRHRLKPILTRRAQTELLLLRTYNRGR